MFGWSATLHHDSAPRRVVTNAEQQQTAEQQQSQAAEVAAAQSASAATVRKSHRSSSCSRRLQWLEAEDPQFNFAMRPCCRTVSWLTMDQKPRMCGWVGTLFANTLLGETHVKERQEGQKR